MVTPIFKSGRRAAVANYRPISILPTISKVAEKWVSKLLIMYVNKGHTTLRPLQFGFHAHHSTETANYVYCKKSNTYWTNIHM